MISNNKGKKIYIHITTYHNEEITRDKVTEGRNMNKEFDNKRNHKSQNGKFICSICLNTRPNLDKNTIESCRRKASCPVCQRHCDVSDHNTEAKPKELVKTNTVFAKPNIDFVRPNAKTVQTSQTDVTDGLNLLNEVLTVFRSKKEIDTSRENSKTILFKDACVATESFVRCNGVKSKLTVSKIFKFSIEEENVPHGCFKYTIINSCQPEVLKNFIKHKSSSVPQIKMDELKNSLKEKTKSKDAIEEVNRMFATVRRVNNNSLDDSNRPIVRSGPRVLPVVKTKNYESPFKNESKAKVSQCNAIQKCQCCQTNNYHMSGGDSFRKNECCQLRESTTRACDKEKCDKCVSMMCCQYKNHIREMQAGFMICECCKSKTKDYCQRGKKDDVQLEDGSTSF